MPQRRLIAILAADVAGYSRLIGVDEEGTLAAVRDIYLNLASPAVESHHGRIFKTTGDGLMAEFGSVVDAVRCAVQIQASLATRNADNGSDRRIAVRIGINLGDVVVAGDDIFGDGVNIAARLEAIAPVGGICVSQAVYDQVLGKLDIAFDDIGEQEVKNIARPVRVYRTRGAAIEEEPPPPALPDRPSIVVLPFANMSDGHEQEYFADGIAEDIITGLARFRSFFVIARNSSFTYKGRVVDVRQVGRELGVRYVLEGSVRRGGNRLRITAQLVEAATGNHLWADKYDGAIDDVFDLQDQITAAVVGVIEPSIRQAEIERAKRKRPGSLNAYDLYLQALPFAWANAPAEASKALELLDQALSIDPAYGVAHGIAAWCYIQKFLRTGNDPSDRAAAIRHAHAALTSGTDDATALAFAGFVFGILDYDKDLAVGTVERALALNSNSSIAYARSAYVHAFVGRLDTAIEHAERAIRLSPLDTMRYSAENARALAYFHGGRYVEAADAALSIIRANPRYELGYAMLAASYARLERFEEAAEAVRRLRDANPQFSIKNFMAISMGTDTHMKLLLAALRDAGLP